MSGEKPMQDLREAEKEIKKSLKDEKIDETEIKDTDTATAFLKAAQENKNKDKEIIKIKNRATEITGKYKVDVQNAIIKYFDVKMEEGDAKVNLSQKNLTSDQIQAYINTITWLNVKNGNDPAYSQITKLTEQLQEKQKDLDAKEKVKKEESFIDLLDSDANMVRAQKLFENNKLMWDNIFNNVTGGKLKLTPGANETQEQNEKQEKNFEKLLHIYSGCETKDNGATRTYDGKNITDFSYNIITAPDGDLTYSKGDQYIKVQFKVDGKDVIKDIMFGKEVKVIEVARAKKGLEAMKKELNGNKTLTSNNIEKMQKIGSYECLRLLVQDNVIDLTESLKGDLLKNVKDYYDSKKNDPTIENKEDGYYTTIAEMVVKQARKGQREALQEYLKHVSKDEMKYLGRTTEEQKKNYRILSEAVTRNSKYQADSEVRKDITEKLTGIGEQLFPPKSLAERAKEGLKGILDVYGEAIITLFNFLGIGKSKLYDICKMFGIDFKEVDEYYTKVYGLEKDTKSASDEITKKYEDITRTDEEKKELDLSDPKKLQAEFTKKILPNQNDIFPKTNQTNTFLQNMNPTLLHNLIIKFNQEKEDGKKPEEKINEQDILIRDDKGKYQIKENGVEKLGNDKQTIIDILIKDPHTWDIIREANHKISGYLPQKGGTDQTRSDLTTRLDFTINEPKDMVKYLNYYAFSGKTGDLDYVITETK